jgi:hypothetical protein
MSRSIIVSLALAAIPLTLACDQSGTAAQAEVTKAQVQANTDIAKANTQANATAVAAQAQADKKIGAVEADFAKTREDYRHVMQTDVDAINKTLSDLDAKEKTATGKAKADLDGALPSLRTQRDAFVTDMRGIDKVDALGWDAAKARLDKEWTDLKAAADKAG